MKKYFCKIEGCNREITYNTVHYGKGTCQHHCNIKLIHKRNYCKDCNKQISLQAKRCMSCASKIFSKRSPRMKGKVHSKETKLKMSQSNSGKNNGFYGKHHSKESINKMLSSEGRKNWQKRLGHTKNSKEILIENLLNFLFPNEYKYIGNGKVWIDGFNPDFINCNGQKKIVEFYGDYWHKRPDYIERDKRRLKAYNKYGYDTLIIWQSELNDIRKVKEKLMNFNEIV